MKPEDRPIGYWLRELDQRIEGAFGAALDRQGLRRRHWQLLNGLGSEDPLWEGQGECRQDLVQRGWMRQDGALTDDGERARAAIAADVAAVRRRVAEGVPVEDYLTTVRTLARMAENLSA
ncbi:hypothetical protein [Dactylosporangium sp. NPDC050588]|uniref:hypothetical protein n=1 Tax=Dactylosporangium sp. NPDC050588 TaxID=3157211 RepID=UPI0033D19DE5